MSDFGEIRRLCARKAITFDIGGFRPSADHLSSWFGRVSHTGRGESWPTSSDGPMVALCQIRLDELPFRPPRLDDLEFLSVFINPLRLPLDEPNGSNWCLRAYRSLEDLTIIERPSVNHGIKEFPMRPRIIEEDFPCWDDLPIEIPEEIESKYEEEFENQPGLKMGGWPTLAQSEIFWAPWNDHPASPEFVFQIDSCNKANWMWGDSGTGYLGRGTTSGHEDEWALSWQCY